MSPDDQLKVHVPGFGTIMATGRDVVLLILLLLLGTGAVWSVDRGFRRLESILEEAQQTDRTFARRVEILRELSSAEHERLRDTHRGVICILAIPPAQRPQAVLGGRDPCEALGILVR